MDDPSFTVQGLARECQTSQQTARPARCGRWTAPSAECLFYQGCNLGSVRRRAHLGSNGFDDCTHGFRSGGACCGSTRYFGCDDRLKFFLAHARRQIALEHRELGALARLSVAAPGFLIDIGGFRPFFRLSLQHGDDLLVGERHGFVTRHRGILHGGDGHPQRRFLRVVARLHRGREVVL